MKLKRLVLPILATAVLTLLATLIVLNLRAEKKIAVRPVHSYPVADQQFLRSMSVLLGPPLLDGNRAYVGTFNAEVLALDLTRRAVVWRYSQPDAEFPYYSSAALAGGRVVLGGRDKMVHAIGACRSGLSCRWA